MAKVDSNYYLIKVDSNTGDIEYFDFETMDFLSEKKEAVPLSTIDALTTLFANGQELDNYLSRKETVEREYHYSFEIIFKSKENEPEKSMKPVWNDYILNSISKISDNEVDFTNDKNYETLITIIDTIKKPKSTLARKIAGAEKEATRLTDGNKKIIGILAKTNKSVPIVGLMLVFASYKEFRALYLNYKEYMGDTVYLEEQLRKVKSTQ